MAPRERPWKQASHKQHSTPRGMVEPLKTFGSKRHFRANQREGFLVQSGDFWFRWPFWCNAGARPNSESNANFGATPGNAAGGKTCKLPVRRTPGAAAPRSGSGRHEVFTLESSVLPPLACSARTSQPSGCGTRGFTKARREGGTQRTRPLPRALILRVT